MLAPNTYVQKYMRMLLSLQKQEERKRLRGYFYTSNEPIFNHLLIPVHRRAKYEIPECEQESVTTDLAKARDKDTPSNRTPYSSKASNKILFFLNLFYY